MARWFTSDQHFGHANIIRYSRRPFAGVRHMAAELSGRWMDRVAPDDEVYVLGDLAVGDVEAALIAVSRLPGRKLLVPGNHDRCFPGRRNAEDWAEVYNDAGITVLDLQVTTEIAGVPVVLCHFPPAGDSQDADRFPEARPHTDAWVLHGHVHRKWQRNGRWINVGVDVWDYAPVGEDVIGAILAGTDGIERAG